MEAPRHAEAPGHGSREYVPRGRPGGPGEQREREEQQEEQQEQQELSRLLREATRLVEHADLGRASEKLRRFDELAGDYPWARDETLQVRSPGKAG
ncbi:hypothetical protein [Rubrobacter aplysinae]|uniref:hypothetical protein n=1 Tax=Rubrobacter aplysinae TaxID=909625 RepID=UPI00064BE9D3|nr:hypothetical protein [Rubrobacter aplysinae]